MLAENNESMCMSCSNCVLSLRWGDTKCKTKSVTMYGIVKECNSYKPLKKGASLEISQDDYDYDFDE